MEEKKYFPCPYCKTTGGDFDYIDTYHKITLAECSGCDGMGFIEVRGKKHREIKAFKIGLEILDFVRPSKDGYEVKEIVEVGEKALGLVKKKS